jgi:hypothetical protein
VLDAPFFPQTEGLFPRFAKCRKNGRTDGPAEIEAPIRASELANEPDVETVAWIPVGRSSHPEPQLGVWGLAESQGKDSGKPVGHRTPGRFWTGVSGLALSAHEIA